ncbi:single-stranded DNA-binding protein [Granulicatella adiacens]|uniref:Single-stranded DNA-binding protein n=1 Tax=Granulicatella adiacens ATCC 49175 TaxID=638301 RepID=C8NHW9_9LACT|nr:single-stranded DNA-binding protein [Granulicatella adiacens]EEW36782.1 single-strand binding family protein [Granulicatella adiacens ATCC 49175]UAK94552.1 single-stranded DNA-binding protein [Granulicatella adiacens]
MINNVVLVGRLTKKPELKFTANGTKYTQFSVAVQKKFKSQNGEYESDFISCFMWSAAAENFTKFTNKGSLVGIEGRIQTRSYDKDGKRVYITEVVAENFSLLESKKVTESRSNVVQPIEESPFNGVSDDDLPF